MLIPTIIMGLLAFILFIISTLKGNGQNIAGLMIGYKLFLQVIPLLIFALIIAGLIQTMLSDELISKWVGAESGMRGILIGSLVGGLTPGGPFVCMPIAAGLLKTGASIGTTVAFLTSWSLWAIIRIPIEVGMLGWKFAILRITSTLFFPPMAGIIANFLGKALFKL